MAFEWRNWRAGYVNLDSRPDRRRHIQTELARVGLAAYRQRGMLPHEYTGPEDQVQVMRQRTPGAIGCHFSQRKIIADNLDCGREILVLEDDVVFCDDLAVRLDHLAEFLAARPWDIVWLGATFHTNPPVWHKDTLGRDAELTEDPRILRTYGIWSTYAWVVNRDSGAKVLELLDRNVHRSIGIDWLMIQVQPELQTYCYVPGIAKQYDNQSNIGKAITHFSHFAKLGPYWWQARREQFDPTTYNWAEARP
jgi:GR25 family glycosyltransferase involved in LPS biosynthesis